MVGRAMRPAARGSHRGALFGVCLGAALLAAGCTRTAPRPPVLLITLHGLRADVVGAFGGPRGLTPHFDAFAEAASAKARAVAPASSGGPALAALFTGLRPWQSQVLYDGLPLSRRFATLPSVLAEAGYRTSGFTEDPTLRRAGGFINGFELLQAQTLRARTEIERRLCGPEPGFVWVHFDLVSTGYQRHDAFLAQAGGASSTLPEALSRAEIERLPDAATPAERAAASTLYRSGVAEADAQVGELLDALRDCGHFDAALVAVLGDHGEGLGENGAAGHGNGLGRDQVEVPFALKLPLGSPRTAALAVPATERVSTTRLYATVLDALAFRVPPGVAPPLSVRDGGGAESEAYRLDGENLFSLVEGDLQLVRSVRFAPADPVYAAARRAMLDPVARDGMLRAPKAVINQLTRAFRRTLPYRDRGDVQLELRRWLPGGGSEPVTDPATLARLDQALERAYFRFVAQELTPAEARRR